ncbi:MAG: hypothetical protein A3K19_07575 [Lentisphaerae bacterium RIFOXYB12_FULL_65_16]|nr:MAG: hypothetical protein A3K18_05190 [Lentisphaerae bacterium RIFOXYA12_64_32]OGV93399.1 MAG: hypothetical protein A3K19_07575 [Lentisphaerae bacterium RIFOXYB12_FULL_65_16]
MNRFGLVFGLCAVAATCVAEPLNLYVAPQGRDEWSGTRRHPTLFHRDGPFKTLDRARDELRQRRTAGSLPAEGVVVELQPGTYYLSQTFELTADDSGTASAPVVYRARVPGTARIVGGVVVSEFGPVTDPALRERLPDVARDHVVQADLSGLGIKDFGSPEPDAKGCEVFFETRPLTLARWPNDGFANVADITDAEAFKTHNVPGSKAPVIVYEGDRPERWGKEPGGWLNGFWFWDWAEGAQPIQSIDVAAKRITMGGKPHSYGYRKGQWYYAFNLLCELDQPGEWYIDRERQILFLWPPDRISDESVVLSVLPTCIRAAEAKWVTFRGLTLEAARGNAIEINGGEAVRVEACTVRNTGYRAIVANGGKTHAVVGCDIYDTGNGAVTLIGGDRPSLNPAGHLLENTWIRRYGRLKRTFCTGVELIGVGQIARRNLIHDAPYIALWFKGNDHVIELNEIHSVCYEANDSGAIYAGRDWAMRGSAVRYNYVHDVYGFRGHGCNGIYLDDMFSGVDVIGNLVVRVPRAFLIGGGRDNVITDNIMVDCKDGMHIDARALGWAKGSVDGCMTKDLNAMPYTGELWLKRYPKLQGILDDDPGCPKGNIVERNISVRCNFDRMCAQAKQFGTIRDNLVDVDPLFVDPAHDDYRLQPGSPAFAVGFKPAPLDQIGLYADTLRASWPVRHEVRKEEAVPAQAALLKPIKVPSPAATPPPVFRVPRRTAEIAIDGVMGPSEWEGMAGQGSLALNQTLERTDAGCPSTAWLCYDEQAFWVCVDSQVSAAAPLQKTPTWGSSDAVEIAIRNPAGGEKAPVLVLRGFPGGAFESSTEAGASTEVAKKAGEGVQFAAGSRGAGNWQAEWRIPFASLGIDPKQQRRMEFNLTVRKSAQPLWVLWVGTLDLATWDVRNGGVLELQQ